MNVSNAVAGEPPLGTTRCATSLIVFLLTNKRLGLTPDSPSVLNSFARAPPLLLLFVGGRADPKSLALFCSLLLLLLLACTNSDSLLLNSVVATTRCDRLFDCRLHCPAFVGNTSSWNLDSGSGRILRKCILNFHHAVVKLGAIKLLDGLSGRECLHVDECRRAQILTVHVLIKGCSNKRTAFGEKFL